MIGYAVRAALDYQGAQWPIRALDESGSGAGPFWSAVAVQPGGDPGGILWSYRAPSGGLANSLAAVPIVAAPGASLRNYISSFQIMTEALGAPTEFVIRETSGGNVLWRIKLLSSGILQPVSIPLRPDLKASALNTGLEIATLTAVTGAVYFNAQGYNAP